MRPLAAVAALAVACGVAADDPVDACGPELAVVARVLDGDTVELAGGEREHVRVVGVDAPEVAHGADQVSECYADEAAAYLRRLVLDQEVRLGYDVAGCRDRYGRLLAVVEAPDGDVGTLLVGRGLACAYYVPPVGDAQRDELADAELRARTADRGLWGACASDPPECAR